MEQTLLDSWFLRQDIVDRLLHAGAEGEEATAFGDRILRIATSEGAVHQSMSDPVDRSIALVLSLVREEGLDAWDIDLEAFLEIFTERVREEAESVDLPSCGRLMRLAWEVLGEQTLRVYTKATTLEEEVDEMNFELDFGWEVDVDDDAFAFTTSVLEGSADDVLPTLFDGRLRRPEGRPTTLSELLAAFKDAADEAEHLQQREDARAAAEAELRAHLDDVGGRMHDEDLEGDIERCWNALRKALSEHGGHAVPIEFVVHHLEADDPEAAATLGGRSEGNVAAFIASLFLVHRRLVDVVQEHVPEGPVLVRDLWPGMARYAEVRSHIEALEASEEASRGRPAIVGRAAAAAEAQHVPTGDAEATSEEDDPANWLVE